jgi:hypothetical protein
VREKTKMDVPGVAPLPQANARQENHREHTEAPERKPSQSKLREPKPVMPVHQAKSS